MILALNMHCQHPKTVVAAVFFKNLDDDQPCEIFLSTVSGIEIYEPGWFYKLELP